MAKAIAAFEGGIHGRVHYAIDKSLNMFVRFQSRGRFGYVWSAWKFHSTVERVPETVQSGFSVCYPAGQYSCWGKWRLPCR